jgi:hypothetical protein
VDDLGVKDGITLKYILKPSVLRVWIGLLWLRVGTDDGLL